MFVRREERYIFMEIKQLEIFVRIAKNLSFSKTAQELYVSQPTVSAHISALEKALGCGLFIRSTKEVSLTKTGVDFLAYAKKILALRDQAILSAGAEDRNMRGAIDIISSTIPAQFLLPEIIASFQKQWPNIVFRVEQADSQRVEREMSSFRYDFGMVGTIPGNDRFNCNPIFDDELVLAMPNGISRDSRDIRENFADFVRQTPFISREVGSGTRKEIEALFSKIGVDMCELHIPAYFSDTHSILLAISHGIGVSLISKVSAKLYADAGLLKIVEMNDPLFRRQIYLLHNKELWMSPRPLLFLKLS